MTDAPDRWADLRRPIFAGGVWETKPVEEQPELTLARWMIIESKGERYFVGWVLENGEGRVSSRIVTFDKERLRGVTQSGRVYQLRADDEGLNRDALYVLGVWLSRYGMTDDDWTRIDLDAL